MEQKIEIWKDVVGYEGLYKVSNLGRIKVLTYWDKPLKEDLFMNLVVDNRKYIRVSLTKNRKYKKFQLHRIICAAFHENPDNLPFVNHKNAIKTDNNPDNLEWCTREYNSYHAKVNYLYSQ